MPAHFCTLKVATKIYSIQKKVTIDTYASVRDFACSVKQIAAKILTHANRKYSPNKM